MSLDFDYFNVQPNDYLKIESIKFAGKDPFLHKGDILRVLETFGDKIEVRLTRNKQHIMLSLREAELIENGEGFIYQKPDLKLLLHKIEYVGGEDGDEDEGGTKKVKIRALASKTVQTGSKKLNSKEIERVLKSTTENSWVDVTFQRMGEVKEEVRINLGLPIRDLPKPVTLKGNNKVTYFSVKNEVLPFFRALDKDSKIVK